MDTSVNSSQTLSDLRYFLKRTLQYRTDWVTPVCMLLLGVMSIFFIYSAQSYNMGNRWKVQIGWLCVSFGAYFCVSLVNYKTYMRYAHILYGACILLLLMLWTPLGERHFGALRWLNLKYFYIQPSETAKIGTLILASSILARSKITTFRQSLDALMRIGICFALPLLLIFLQPDLGSALIFPPMLFALLYISRLSTQFFVTTLIAFVMLLSLVAWDAYNYHQFLKAHHYSPTNHLGAYEAHSWFPLKDYQRNRILVFAAPEVIDPKGIGVSWNLRQSLISVGSGGILGKGHNQGTQAKLGYLPQSVATNDFIFSVLAEESGFVGGIVVLGLYLLMVGNGLRIASLAKDRFGMSLAVGVTVILMMHVLVNIGMTIGLMPITGVSLPFLSYGGSFLLSCCILQGLVQSVYRFRKDFS